MNMLLKIVQGPNAGAEVALAEGMTVGVGRGETCDIVLADQSLADVACELEVNGDRVRILLPGGAEERLEPFRVRFLSETTAVAVGPEDAAWDELIWPERGTSARAEAQSAFAAPDPPDSGAEVPAGRKFSGRAALAAALLLMPVAFAAAVFLLWPWRSALSGALGPAAEYVRPAASAVRCAGLSAWERICGSAGDRGSEDRAVAPVAAASMDIRDVAEKYGLAFSDSGGAGVLSGNFATRARRLSATAEAYAARPGVRVELSDDESLCAATAEVLSLVGEGGLDVRCATNRVVALAGRSRSAASLRTVLEAIRADVPYVKSVDCSRVTLGDSDRRETAPAAANSPRGEMAPSPCRAPRRDAAVKMPVVGVMTHPYPCLVLRDGSRVTEGAEFGGFVIEDISADTIRVSGPDGAFEWRP